MSSQDYLQRLALYLYYTQMYLERVNVKKWKKKHISIVVNNVLKVVEESYF